MRGTDVMKHNHRTCELALLVMNGGDGVFNGDFCLIASDQECVGIESSCYVLLQYNLNRRVSFRKTA